MQCWGTAVIRRPVHKTWSNIHIYVSLMHVSMMNVSMMHVCIYDACMYLWCMYLWCVIEEIDSIRLSWKWQFWYISHEKLICAWWGKSFLGKGFLGKGFLGKGFLGKGFLGKMFLGKGCASAVPHETLIRHFGWGHYKS